MDERITPELDADMKKTLALDEKQVGAVDKWNQSLGLLRRARLCYRAKFQNAQVLVHPSNRGGLGLNAFNAHRTGARIWRAGPDMRELAKATAFELNPNEPKKSLQVGFNKDLVSRASNMLAPVSGVERILSVACSHTAAFCKAASSGCTTDQEQFKDAGGKLNFPFLCTNPVMKEMLCDGWDWEVVAWVAEHQWPHLPSLAQRALNASNNVASQETELETACTIANDASLQSLGDGPIDWDRAIQMASSTVPSCLEYIDVVAEYTQKYGGGKGAPMMIFLDKFSKEYGQNVKLGQEYFSAVTHLVFPAKSKVYPHIRTALLATNLISEKIVDGVARLLTKSDVERFKSKAVMPDVENGEVAIEQGWRTLNTHLKSQQLTEGQAHGIIGRFMTRLVLKIAKKGKMGPEQRVFDSLEAIKSEFVADLREVLGPTVKIECPWSAEKSQPSEDNAASASSSAFTNFSDIVDPVWHAKAAGFDVGEYCYPKKDGKATAYKLTGFGSNVALVAQVQLPHEVDKKPAEISIDIETLLSKWQLWKDFTPTVLVEFELGGPNSVKGSDHIKRELSRSLIFTELVRLAKEREPAKQTFAYTLHPVELRAATAVRKGEAVLTPLSDLLKISTMSTDRAAKVIVEDTSFYIEPPPKVKSNDASTWSKSTVFVPFWWVGTTDDMSLVNMQEVPKTHNGITIPARVNSKALKKGDLLMMYKAKADPTADEGGQPPAKRTKR